MAHARRPKGALEVAGIIASVSSSLYGNNDRIKYIVDGDVSIQLSCAARIIQNLDIEHFAGHLVNDVVENHHKTYGCSNKTLLTMMSLLVNSANTLKDQGLHEEAILKGLHQAIELCIGNFQSQSVRSFFEKETRIGQQHPYITPYSKEKKIMNVTIDDALDVSNIKRKDVIDKPATHDSNIGKFALEGVREIGTKATADMVELVMKPLPTDNIEDYDDCSWFFDKGDAPSFDLDVSMINQISKLTDVEQTIQTYKLTDVSSNTTPSLPHDTVFSNSCSKTVSDNYDHSSSDIKVSCLNDVKDTTDFDDCFGEDEWNEGFRDEVTQDANSSGTPAISAYQHEVLDEFDDCFSDINFQSHREEKPVIESIHLKSDYFSIKTSHASSQAGTCSSTEKKRLGTEIDVGIDVSLKILERDVTSEKEPKLKPVDAEVKLEESSPNSWKNAELKELQEFWITQGKKELGLLPKITGCDITTHAVQDSSTTNKGEMLEKIESLLSQSCEKQKNASKNFSRHFKTMQGSLNMQNKPSPSIHPTCSDIDREKVDNERITRVSGADNSEPPHQSGPTFVEGEGSKIINNGRAGVGILGDSPTLRGRTTDGPTTPAQTTDFGDHRSSIEKRLHAIFASQPKLNVSKLQRSSRHFKSNDESCDIESTRASKAFINTLGYNDSTKSVEKCFVTIDKLKLFIGLLSHGLSDVSKLVTTAVWSQQISRRSEELECENRVDFNEFIFDAARVHSLCIGNTPSSRSEVVNGFLVSSSQEQLSHVQVNLRKRRALLIKGDIGVNCRHKGMSKKVESKAVTSTLSSSNRYQRWLDSLVSNIKELSVQALLVKGKVSEDVENWCSSLGILVLSDVPSRVLHGIEEASNALLATYVTECTEENVVEELELRVWRSDWMDQMINGSHGGYIRITIPQNLVQTLVICHPSGERAAVIEEQCWHVIHRVHNVIKTGLYMYGCPERYLSHMLYKKADEASVSTTKDSPKETLEIIPFVMRTVAEGFTTLEALAYSNITGESINQFYREGWPEAAHCREQNFEYSTDFEENESDPLRQRSVICFDDCLSKTEAYRSSLYLVRQLLLTDLEVITGIDTQGDVWDSDIISIL